MRSVVLLVALAWCVAADPSVTRTAEEISEYKEYLDRTQTDDGLTLEERNAANPKAKAWENSGKYQGDIVLHPQQKEELLKEYSGENVGRNGVIGRNPRWPSNTIIYQFDNVFTQTQRNQILAGMATIERNTCIRFRQRTATSQRNFIFITGKSDGCYAHVGHWPTLGAHTYNLARGCFHPQTIIHEFLHSAGFEHMHCTYSRDTYVRVFFNNIQQGFAFAFDKYSNRQVSMFSLPYEYNSNMHYDRWAFSRNGQATMTPIFNDNNQMGQITHVTARDWLRARRLYNCPGAWSATADDERIYEHGEEAPQQANQEMPEAVPQEMPEETPQEISAE